MLTPPKFSSFVTGLPDPVGGPAAADARAAPGAGVPGRTGASGLGRLELRCPPMSHTLVEAMDFLANPERMEVRPVTEMVERDPIVTARLLQKVNSAFYGLHRAVTSSERAVIMLGPVAVVGIVAGMGMLKLRAPLAGSNAGTMGPLVAHSLATAHLTRHLVETAPYLDTRAPQPRNGTAFTAGLLHDFGKIVLAYNFPEDAAALYQERALDGLVAADVREQERLVFGYDYVEAGTFAALKLQFPDLLADVIRLHLSPEALLGEGVPPQTARLLRSVAAASCAADLMGHGVAGPRRWDDAPDDALWQTIVERDLPLFQSPAVLLEHLQSLTAFVDHYVSAVVTEPDGAETPEAPPEAEAAPPAAETLPAPAPARPAPSRPAPMGTPGRYNAPPRPPAF